MIESDIDHREDIEDKKEVVANTKSSGSKINRSKIEDLVKNPEWRKFVSEKVAVEYEHFLRMQGSNISVSNSTSSARASQTKAVTNDNELKEVYDYMSKQWESAQTVSKRINSHIDSAIGDKIISDSDREFYDKKLEENFFNGKENVTDEMLKKAEKDLTDSLKNRNNEREEFDVLSQNPIVKDGVLRVDKKTEIKIPNADDYLKMTVPERRKFLKKVKDALPQAKKFAEKEGDVESQKMTKEYTGLLEDARKKGLIGKVTIKKYQEAFEKIDNKEKAYWIEEMKNGSQLKRYKQLWENIRKTFKGPALRQMEGLREKMGYSGLLKEFGKAKEKEGNGIESQYEKKLSDLLNMKVISKHTYTAFLQDIKSQPLEEKQRYLESFPIQMRRYETLRVKIDQMKDKGAKKTLDKMYDSPDNGFKQIESAYNRLSGTSGSSAPGAVESDADKELNTIENREIRKAVKSGMDKLEYTQKLTFTQKISNFFEGSTTQKEDPMTYQKNLHQARKKHRKLNFKEIRSHHLNEPQEQEKQEVEQPPDIKEEKMTLKHSPVNEEVQERQEEEARKPGPAPLKLIHGGKDKKKKPKVSKEVYDKRAPYHAKKEVNKDRTFEKKTYYNNKKEKQRVMRVQVNSIEGIKSLNTEQSIDNKNTRINNMVWLNGRYIELGLNDTRAMIRYNRKCLAKATGPEQERKAA